MSKVRKIIQEISVEKMEIHISNLEGIRHPVYAPEALEKAADYIWESMHSYGLKMSWHHFIEDGKQFRNIIGFHQGTKHPEKKVMVLAHYDTVAISPGADDNASGVAAVLELGRVLKQYKFEKSVLFVGVNLEEDKVDGEQDTPSLRGSSALAATAKKQSWKIEGVVNFDTIAYAGDNIAQKAPDNNPFEMPEVGNFIAVVGNENSANMVRMYGAVIEENQIALPYLPLVIPGNGEGLPDTRRSDHAPFWDIGTAAIMLTDTANFRTPHYHQASDTLETLNLDFATEVCRAGGCLVSKMAGIENAQ